MWERVADRVGVGPDMGVGWGVVGGGSVVLTWREVEVGCAVVAVVVPPPSWAAGITIRIFRSLTPILTNDVVISHVGAPKDTHVSGI